jgi:hypothetical protein
MPPTANDLSYRLLIFGAAISGGVLLAIVVQVVLAQLGLDLAAIWHAVKVPRAAQLRAATAWWLIAGITFMAGFAIAALVRYLVANPGRVRGWVGWIGGLVAVVGLTWVGREATTTKELGALASVITGLAVLVAGGALSLLGAFFAMRR